MIQNYKHMQYQIFGVLVLSLVVGCRNNVILIGGVQTERIQFCAGEELTLLCQNDTLVYEWVYPGGGISVTQRNNMSTDNGFIAVYVNATTATLQFVVSSSMNGITISCTTTTIRGIISATHLEVLGTSSMTCPHSISAVGMDNCTSVSVSLHGVSRCTREYSASISGETEVIASVLNATNYDTQILDIGSFVLSNSSLKLCSTYVVSVNVSYFDDSRMACSAVIVQLPTNPSTDVGLLPTTITSPSSNTSSEVTIIIVVVIPVSVLMLIIAILVIIVICVNKYKINKIDCLHTSSEQAQDRHIIPHKESPSGEVDALPKKNNKGSKKNGRSDRREDSKESNTREGDPQIIPHKESPSGDIYAEPIKNKGSKKTGKINKREKILMNSKVNKGGDSKEGNKQEGDPQIIVHEKSPSGALYTVVEKKNRGSKNTERGGKSDEISKKAKVKNDKVSKEGNTQETLVCTKTNNTSSSLSS